jgi:hypothetical protein
MAGEPLGPVIVGVDGSPLDLAVVDLAVQASALRSVPLVVVQVQPEVGPGPAAEAIARARARYPDVPITVEALAGHPADALAARSQDACLLVVGHHRGQHGGRRSRVRGAEPVVQRLLDRAEKPVMVQRQLTRIAGSQALPVLVCVDGAPESEAALEFAFAEAALRAAALLAMYLWPPAAVAAVGDDQRPGREEADRAFADLVATWSDKYPEVPVRLALRHGLDAAIVLTAASRSAQLAVVGSCRPLRHRVPSRSALSAFIDRAECPVTVVPWGAP